LFIKTLSIATAAVIVAGVGLKTAEAKDLNGASSYVGVSYVSTDIDDIGYNNSRYDRDTGRTQNEVGFKKATGGLLHLGHDLGYVTAEAEFGYRTTKVDKILKGSDARGTVNIGSAMLNLGLEYSVGADDLGAELGGFTITPFVSAGGGVLAGDFSLKYDDVNLDSTNRTVLDDEMFAAPALQAKVGLAIGLTHGVEAIASYSEMKVFVFNNRNADDLHLKTVSGGLRFNF